MTSLSPVVLDRLEAWLRNGGPVEVNALRADLRKVVAAARESTAAPMKTLAESTGVAMIAAEQARQRQLGWTEEHDDSHADRDLTARADRYLHRADAYPLRSIGTAPRINPRRLEQLAKAGALIASEIDRVGRVEAGDPL